MALVRCFHNRARCDFCKVGARPKVVRRHCHACGRFVANDHRGPTCNVCTGRFVPLRLPLAG